MKSINEGIEFLTSKYAVAKKVELIDRETVSIDGKKSAILPWRCERRFVELKKLAQGGEMHGISVIRVARIDRKGADIMKMFYREADICEYVLGSEVKEVFAIENSGKALNAILKMDSGVICTLEIAATLGEGEKVIDKHEIIAEKGVACDRVVDTQIPQSSIYVFANGKNQEFIDTDAELYGLSIDDAAIARQCFELARDGICLCEQAEHLSNLLAACKKSIAAGKNIIL